MSITAMARAAGLTKGCLTMRLWRGTPLHEALNPNMPNRGGKPLTYNGRTQSSAAWARELGIKPSTLCRRLLKGYTFTGQGIVARVTAGGGVLVRVDGRDGPDGYIDAASGAATSQTTHSLKRGIDNIKQGYHILSA